MVSLKTWLAIEHGLIQMLVQLAVVHGAGGPSEQLMWLYALKPPSCHPLPMPPGPVTLNAIKRTSNATLALAAVFLATTLKALLTAFTSKDGTCRRPILTRAQQEGAVSLAHDGNGGTGGGTHVPNSLVCGLEPERNNEPRQYCGKRLHAPQSQWILANAMLRGTGRTHELRLTEAKHATCSRWHQPYAPAVERHRHGGEDRAGRLAVSMGACSGRLVHKV
jgi:hypothetical protein